jgi:hypothetical protein
MSNEAPTPDLPASLAARLQDIERRVSSVEARTQAATTRIESLGGLLAQLQAKPAEPQERTAVKGPILQRREQSKRILPRPAAR